MSKLAFAICAAILCFVPASQAQGSRAGCRPEELDNSLQRSDPAYADAIGLAATLQNQGFTIQCVLPSKFTRFLPRQTGAALFRTTMGDFEALFRPREQSFDDVFISEKSDLSLSSSSNSTGYRYIFRDPNGRMLRHMVGRETFFVRQHNMLFVTWQKDTAANLNESHLDER